MEKNTVYPGNAFLRHLEPMVEPQGCCKSVPTSILIYSFIHLTRALLLVKKAFHPLERARDNQIRLWKNVLSLTLCRRERVVTH